MSILQVNNLSVSYDQKKVVNDCSFELAAGEIVVLLGASGEGKTSILKAIAGKVQASSGEMLFKEEPIKGPQDKLLPGRDEIQVVDQDFSLDQYHTVKENIRLKLLQFDKEYQEKRTVFLLELCGLSELENQKAHLLSGGQKQRLAIARALAIEPDVLLLDEPFNQLDFKSKTKVSDYLRAYLKEQDLAVLMVTHNGIEALEWADKIVYLEKGSIRRIDTPTGFYESPKSLEEATFFGYMNTVLLEGGKIHFRPSDFSLKQTTDHSFCLKIKYIKERNFGWYSDCEFNAEGQQIRLISTQNLSGVDEIFVKSFSFPD